MCVYMFTAPPVLPPPLSACGRGYLSLIRRNEDRQRELKRDTEGRQRNKGTYSKTNRADAGILVTVLLMFITPISLHSYHPSSQPCTTPFCSRTVVTP